MRNTAAEFIRQYCNENKDGFLLAGDAGYGVWEKFREEMPEQYMNPGINEAATIGIAAGMALRGHRVFVYNIIPFLLMRCYEQVRLDICYQNLPVIMVGIGSGVTYAPAGMTHYSLEDIAIAATFPNMNILSPSDPNQVKAALEYAAASDKPSFIRISRSGEPNITTAGQDISVPFTIRNNSSSKAVIFHGSISDAVLDAGEKADFDIYSMPLVQPLNTAEADKIISKYEKVFIVEEHFEYGGLFTMLKQSSKEPEKLESIAIKNEYIHTIGNRDYVRAHYGIDENSIAERLER